MLAAFCISLLNNRKSTTRSHIVSFKYRVSRIKILATDLEYKKFRNWRALDMLRVWGYESFPRCYKNLSISVTPARWSHRNGNVLDQASFFKRCIQLNANVHQRQCQQSRRRIRQAGFCTIHMSHIMTTSQGRKEESSTYASSQLVHSFLLSLWAYIAV